MDYKFKIGEVVRLARKRCIQSQSSLPFSSEEDLLGLPTDPCVVIGIGDHPYPYIATKEEPYIVRNLLRDATMFTVSETDIE